MHPAQPPTPETAAGSLQDLVLDSGDVEKFLDNLSELAVARLSSPGNDVLCGITLLRPRKVETVASSSEDAKKFDELQYSFGDGPCLTAARTNRITHIRDTRQDHQWPDYQGAIAERGIRSVLGVPIPLDGEASCALMLYATTADAFTGDAQLTAETFAREASASLRLAVHIAHLTETSENLKSAMSSRTTIDLAAGIIMGQNRCGHDAAMAILKAASSARNIKLRDVAAGMLTSISQPAPETHFEN
ncbi:GAF and ANTAR domain-containing protein [Arthrobacter sp. H14]|uniref:GAF and ANTAR domain-containing protein n=1 Tax=Arthrobacter sp. H14 TaxID=1312959 RepID=UPI00047C2252|nr:GAF and ANTAR domain-containing protein [Arthrobacter sp. H14]